MRLVCTRLVIFVFSHMWLARESGSERDERRGRGRDAPLSKHRGGRWCAAGAGCSTNRRRPYLIHSSSRLQSRPEVTDSFFVFVFATNVHVSKQTRKQAHLQQVPSLRPCHATASTAFYTFYFYLPSDNHTACFSHRRFVLYFTLRFNYDGAQNSRSLSLCEVIRVCVCVWVCVRARPGLEARRDGARY